MVRCEGVAEVENGEEETDKLPECDDQGDHQRGALCRQDEHATNTHVLSQTVTSNVQPHLGHPHHTKDHKWFCREGMVAN